MDDPLVTEDRVPSYQKVKEKLRQIDNTIIIIRTFYNFDNLSYRFQLIKKEKMCVMEIPKVLLDDLKTDGSSADQELTNILKLYIDSSECWTAVNR